MKTDQTALHTLTSAPARKWQTPPLSALLLSRLPDFIPGEKDKVVEQKTVPQAW